jgi:hypothetical protein
MWGKNPEKENASICGIKELNTSRITYKEDSETILSSSEAELGDLDPIEYGYGGGECRRPTGVRWKSSSSGMFGSSRN